MSGNSPDGSKRSPALEQDFLSVGGKKLRKPGSYRHAMAAVLAASALVPLSQPAAGSTDILLARPELKAFAVPSSAPQLVPPAPAPMDPKVEVRKLKRAQAVREAREERERKQALAAERAAARPDFVAPTDGRFTSGFGARWGSMHSGIDLANSIGTPIVSVADGTVIEAGPASGFGLWVRIQHDNGAITVYGHMYEFSVAKGQRVKAGQQIATIGNNGQSTGPHLHFEVWQGEGNKIDPVSWLASNGVSL